jgi:hypothetical protein
MLFGDDGMTETKKASMGFLQCVAFASLIATLSTPALAQDSRHVRVEFGGGSGWGEMATHNGYAAPLPAGPAYANYNYGRNAESAPPQDRLRLKPMSFGGN